jgi:zinc protease
MAKSELVLVNKPELVQSQVRVAYPGVPRGDADEAPLQVATAILGAGFTSRLLEALRVERSLIYSVGFGSVQQGRGGLAAVQTATKTPTTKQTLDVTLSEIDRFVTQGPDTEELAGVKSYLSGVTARGLQSPADIASQLSMAAFYGLPADYITRRLERIRAVTPEDLKRVSQEHFAASGRTIVLVADAPAVRDSLKTFGPVEEMSFESLLK